MEIIIILTVFVLIYMVGWGFWCGWWHLPKPKKVLKQMHPDVYHRQMLSDWERKLEAKCPEVRNERLKRKAVERGYIK